MPAQSSGQLTSPKSPKHAVGQVKSHDDLGSPKSSGRASPGPVHYRGSLEEMSPAAYFLKHRQSAVDNVEALKSGKKASALLGQSALLQLLQRIFDQLSEGTDIITVRSYNKKVPELAKKYPQLAIHFRKMDKNNDATLDRNEFVEFALSKNVKQATKRLNLVTVHGHETDPVSGQVDKTFKNPTDPARACEMGGPPPLLPWEVHHRVEWVIDELEADRKQLKVNYHGMEIVPGKYISSPSFDAAGVRGFFRFWPNGYFSESVKRERGGGKVDLGGLKAEAWCAIGVFFPHGTHLKFRFFVGDEFSSVRECYWDDGALVLQIWTPSAIEPPKLESFSVGIEIRKNMRQLHVAESIKRTCAGGGPSGRQGRTLSGKEKEAAVPTMRTLEPPALAGLPSPRMMNPWELPHMPERPRNVLHRGEGMNVSTLACTTPSQVPTQRPNSGSKKRPVTK
eukprot:gnl/MRDRNA2_/MRDRNA2_116005_c0_seq1.p1 gnl/MRDRNA2_/MRDRNA2_116005_c0~~gnl/MRDRNA2_/MRDRNA2_116005_c0_seq1.p1  ORF type:complete len:480 (-),score=79.35 gnl/MRDRNA2_/MRDRNA2_116005_c0_seq1:273-1628(-)